MIERRIRPQVLEALADTRVVMVMGARQVGKSTLCEAIARNEHPSEIVSLDDDVALLTAHSDPAGFIADLDGDAFIDEVQRAPGLMLAIKRAVDREQRPGQFLLSGSANLLSSRKITEALTGRIELIHLWPLAQSEIAGATSNFVDALFAASPPRVRRATVGREAFAALVAAGGYPEARAREGRRRNRWFASYLRTTLERDLSSIADVYKQDEMGRLLRLLASRSGNLLRYSSVADSLNLDAKTVKSYIGLLEAIFLVRTVPAWRPGFLQRVVQTPKVYITDSGLLTHLLSADQSRIATDDRVTGIAFETFVAMEIIKHAGFSETDPLVYHFRTSRDVEVDLVLEDGAGNVVAIEVKAKASLSRSDARGLDKLRDAAGDRFIAGVIVHTGEQTLPFGDRLWAVPVSGLWA